MTKLLLLIPLVVLLSTGCAFTGMDITASRGFYPDPAYNGTDLSITLSFVPAEEAETEEVEE